MSTDVFTIDAQVREISGKGASRRLRRLEKMVPAIVYGDNKDPMQISVEHKELLKHLEFEAFYSHVIKLNVAGKSEDVILKDLQRHPSKPVVLHADFMRVSQSKPIQMSVPLHFLNEESCKGVKLGGGKVSHTMTQLEITCLPKHLPEFIEVDLADVEVGQIIHISDIKLPEGVESVSLGLGADHDLPVAAVNKPKGSSEDADSEEGASEE